MAPRPVRRFNTGMTSATGTRLLHNYIGGSWVASSGTEQLDVTNPATGEVRARVPVSTRGDV